MTLYAELKLPCQIALRPRYFDAKSDWKMSITSQYECLSIVFRIVCRTSGGGVLEGLDTTAGVFALNSLRDGRYAAMLLCQIGTNENSGSFLPRIA